VHVPARPRVVRQEDRLAGGRRVPATAGVGETNERRALRRSVSLLAGAQRLARRPRAADADAISLPPLRPRGGMWLPDAARGTRTGRRDRSNPTISSSRSHV